MGKLTQVMAAVRRGRGAAGARRPAGMGRGGLGRGARGAAGTDPAGLAGGRGLGVGYLLIWISFPVIGLIASATVASVFADSAPPEPSSHGLPM